MIINMMKAFWKNKKNKSANESQGSYISPKAAFPPPNYTISIDPSFSKDKQSDLTSSPTYIKQSTSWFGATGFYQGYSGYSGMQGYSGFSGYVGGFSGYSGYNPPTWNKWQRKFVQPKLIFETDGIKHKHPLTNVFV
jgi:hypothetical protein